MAPHLMRAWGTYKSSHTHKHTNKLHATAYTTHTHTQTHTDTHTPQKHKYTSHGFGGNKRKKIINQ